MKRNLQGEVLITTTNGNILTENQALDYSNKDIVFDTVNGSVTFTSEWFYEQALTSLQTINF